MRIYTFLPEAWLEDDYPFHGLVNNGWWELLYEMCDNIQDIVDKNPEEYKDLKVVQLKEKYGTLRAYFNWETDEISNLVEVAEEKSAITCEECGKPGKLRTDRYWILTLCDECNKIDGKSSGEVLSPLA